jgi:hypothetical protein
VGLFVLTDAPVAFFQLVNFASLLPGELVLRIARLGLAILFG